MSDLISREAVLGALIVGATMTELQRRIRAIPAAHVNETQKTEHDRGDMLTMRGAPHLKISRFHSLMARRHEIDPLQGFVMVEDALVEIARLGREYDAAPDPLAEVARQMAEALRDRMTKTARATRMTASDGATAAMQRRLPPSPPMTRWG